MEEGLAEEELAVGAVEDVEKAIAIGVKEEFAGLALVGGVDEDVGFGGVPVVGVVGGELVIPLELAVGGVEGEDGVGVEVVTAAIAVVGVRPGVAGGPVEGVSAGVVGAGEPGGAAAEFVATAFPGFDAGFAVGGDGPMAPDAFAGGGFVGGDETADAPVAASDSGDDHILDDEGRDGAAVLLGFVPENGLPNEAAGDAIEGEKVGVVGDEEDVVAQDGYAAVGTEGGIGDEAGGAGPGVLPDGLAGGGGDGVDLVGAGEIHDAVGDEGNGFEAEIAHVLVEVGGVGKELGPEGDGEGPLEGELVDVGGVDLGEGAIAVAAEVAVVGEPVAGLGVLDPGEGDGAGGLGRGGLGERAGFDAGEGAEIGEEVLEFGGGGLGGGHGRGFVFGDAGRRREGKGVESAFQVLNSDFVGGSIAGETAEGGAGGAGEVDELVAGGEAGGGVEEGVAELVDGEVAGDGGEIGADGGATAGNHVAGGALALAEEVGAAGGGVARDFGVGSGSVERDDEGDEAFEGGVGKGKAGHAGGGDAAGDDVAEALGVAAAEAEVAGEAGALLGAAGVGAVAAGAELGVGLGDVGLGKEGER